MMAAVVAGVIRDPFTPGRAVLPATEVEISVSCRNLQDKDVFSKSDPMCVVYIKEQNSNNFREVGRTETIRDTLNPDFVKKVAVTFYFEESQRLRFEIYDVDSVSTQLWKHDFLGQVECTLGEIVAAQGNQYKKSLSGKVGESAKSHGSIILIAEEVGSNKDVAYMQFNGTNLDKKDFFGKSDPFLVFYRANEDGSWTAVHRTEQIMNTLNPCWKMFERPVRLFCGSDYDRTIKVECYDWNNSGSHDLIGEFTTNMRTLQKGPKSPDNSYECINKKKQIKKGSKYKHSGLVNLVAFRVEQEYSFLDFIKGGDSYVARTQMHFTVAVDFTASNGDPREPNSLHYLHHSVPNQYAVSIKAVGEIIQDYDHDKVFPALGFGARIPPSGQVSHEFYLNGNASNPYCQGVDGVLQAYYHSLNRVQLYGPTNFTPVINHVASVATTCHDGSHYFVLLIITDGVISDMAQTKEAIVKASTLPMSIIIVGVGNADFTAMEELDGDVVRLSSKGRFCERDIVQFVPFSEFQSPHGDWQSSQTKLAKEVLAEIPTQVVGFMKKRGIKPAPRPAGSLPTPAQPPSYPVETALQNLSIGSMAGGAGGVPFPSTTGVQYPGGPPRVPDSSIMSGAPAGSGNYDLPPPYTEICTSGETIMMAPPLAPSWAAPIKPTAPPP